MRTTTALLGGAALLHAAVAQAPGPTSPCNYFLADGRTASWDLTSLYNATMDYTWCVLCVAYYCCATPHTRHGCGVA